MYPGVELCTDSSVAPRRPQYSAPRSPESDPYVLSVSDFDFPDPISVGGEKTGFNFNDSISVVGEQKTGGGGPRSDATQTPVEELLTARSERGGGGPTSDSDSVETPEEEDLEVKCCACREMVSSGSIRCEMCQKPMHLSCISRDRLACNVCYHSGLREFGKKAPRSGKPPRPLSPPGRNSEEPPAPQRGVRPVLGPIITLSVRPTGVEQLGAPATERPPLKQGQTVGFRRGREDPNYVPNANSSGSDAPVRQAATGEVDLPPPDVAQVVPSRGRSKPRLTRSERRAKKRANSAVQKSNAVCYMCEKPLLKTAYRKCVECQRDVHLQGCMAENSVCRVCRIRRSEAASEAAKVVSQPLPAVVKVSSESEKSARGQVVPDCSGDSLREEIVIPPPPSYDVWQGAQVLEEKAGKVVTQQRSVAPTLSCGSTASARAVVSLPSTLLVTPSAISQLPVTQLVTPILSAPVAPVPAKGFSMTPPVHRPALAPSLTSSKSSQGAAEPRVAVPKSFAEVARVPESVSSWSSVAPSPIDVVPEPRSVKQAVADGIRAPFAEHTLARFPLGGHKRPSGSKTHDPDHPSTGSDAPPRQEQRRETSEATSSAPIVPPVASTKKAAKSPPPKKDRWRSVPGEPRPKRSGHVKNVCRVCLGKVWDPSVYCVNCKTPCHRGCKGPGHWCYKCKPRDGPVLDLVVGQPHAVPVSSPPLVPTKVSAPATTLAKASPVALSVKGPPAPRPLPKFVTQDKPVPVIKCKSCRLPGGELCKTCGLAQHADKSCGLSRGECKECRALSAKTLPCITCDNQCVEVCARCGKAQHYLCGLKGSFCSVCSDKLPSCRRVAHQDWTPGEEMDICELWDGLVHTDRVAESFPVRKPRVRRLAHHNAGREGGLAGELVSRGFEPGDYAFMPFHLQKPNHFCALLWCPSKPDEIVYCEPLLHEHAQLPAALEEWRKRIAPQATLVRSADNVRMANRPHDLLCGWCVMNDYVNLVTTGSLRPEAPIPPDGLKGRRLFATYLRTVFGPKKGSAAAMKKSVKPLPPAVRRAMRPVADRIQFEGLAPGEDEGGPPIFRSGLLRLRRTGIEMEAASNFSQPLRALLECRQLHLPTDRTVLRGLSFDQRKRHLYTLDSLMEVMLRGQAVFSTLSPPLAWIKAIEQLQAERAWRSTGALLATAATLMGALERLDQYTGLPPVKLTQHSPWRDAVKRWEKLALRVLPDVTAVSLAEVKVLLSRLTRDATAVLLIAWLHAARVGNVFTVKLKESEIQTHQGVHTWVITWTAAKTTPKVGAYTTHSAISAEWLPVIQALGVGRGPEECLVHPHLERSTVTELRAELHKLDPKHDLRSLRRGSLTAMARTGVDMETLLTYSGHRTVDMLLRYLQRGKVVQQRIQKGASAALKSLH